MAKITKKVLSGSDRGHLISVDTQAKTIHETPRNIEHSEIWLYVVNNSDQTQTINLRINGEEFIVDVDPSKLPIDLYGGSGAKTNCGDKFEAYCPTPNNGVYIGGWVYEMERKNG